MGTKLLKLFLVIIVCGSAAAFFTSCENGSGTPYVPEVLTDDQCSGAGYAKGFFLGKGELCFSLSHPSSENITLAIRGCGKAEAEVIVNGEHHSVTFREGGSTWEVSTVNVSLNAGLNSVIIRRKDNGETGMRIDYIEIDC